MYETKSSNSSKTLWSKEEIELLKSFKTPEDIQAYLDNTPYNPDETCRSPRRVMRDKKAHCLEGALFACAALEFIGYKTYLVYIIAVRDDGHALAIFKRNNKYGCLAKSNFSGLRYRSPIYKSIRELVLSFFEVYFNTARELTLRAYTYPLSLSNKSFTGWHTREDDLYDISDYIDILKTYTIITEKEAKTLRPVDERLYNAGLLDADKSGLYKI